MKRSEMIEILIGTIEAYGFAEGNTPEFVANKMLEDAEEAGMLPPDEIEHDDDCPTYDGDECHGCVPRSLTRWESEDET